MMTDIAAAIDAAGFIVLGCLGNADPALSSAPQGTRTLLLIGWGGGGRWPLFQASPEYTDGAADPLDRWTKRVVDELADRLGARPLYPSDGPPWYPFQSWAVAAGVAYPSPIGLLIHPTYGLWHSYRAALVFERDVALEIPDAGPSPCATCVAQPCLTACPIEAYGPNRFDVGACRTYVASEPERACLDHGCFARDACPVGREWRNSDDQIRFHQRAFIISNLGLA